MLHVTMVIARGWCTLTLVFVWCQILSHVVSGEKVYGGQIANNNNNKKKKKKKKKRLRGSNCL